MKICLGFAFLQNGEAINRIIMKARSYCLIAVTVVHANDPLSPLAPLQLGINNLIITQ